MMLEQKIFDYVCELGRQITRQVLEAYDTELAEKIAMTVTESPYCVTTETISNTCGQSSSEGVWNMMMQQPHPEKHFGMRL